MPVLPTYPSVRKDSSEDSYSRLTKGYTTNGVIYGYLNEFEVYADSTGMQVKVPTGAAILDGYLTDTTIVQSSASSGEQTLSLSPANATNPRIDRVVLQLDKSSPATISLLIVPGTAAVNPSPPTLLNDSDKTTISLAQVRVNAAVSSITAGNVTLERQWTGDSQWVSYSPNLYQLGSGWSPYVSLGDVRAAYRLIGGTACVKFRGLIGMSGSTPSPDYAIELPIKPRYAGEPGCGRCQNTSADVATLLTPGTNGSVQILKGDHTQLSGSGPFYDSFNIMYEIAG